MTYQEQTMQSKAGITVSSTLSGQQPENQKHRPRLPQPLHHAEHFLKTTNLRIPEVILVTIALSVSYALEKP